MCSICGGHYPLDVIQKASQTMKHRGVDFSGNFSDGEVSLAHNRLSIIDLSSEANQPFISSYCPHLVLVYNGEIYNYLEIKQQLQKENIPFYTTSDTEVLLHAYAFYGEKCLEYFNGDFAFAIYDTQKKEFFLARDRLGNKPLFYSIVGDKLLFASEIKAFLSVGHYPFDLQEVSRWLLFSGGDTTKCIYKNIYPFPSGNYGVFKQGILKTYSYWNFTPQEATITNEEQALEELDALLCNCVALRLRTDVPLVLSVSGGVDSSLIAHYILRLGGDCKFFGVSFEGFKQSDEREHIRELASNLGVKIEEITPTLSHIREDFKNLVFSQDEIFRSLSVYSQFLLFKTIAPFCKVALGGQGADELFGGYYHHVGRYLFCNHQALEERILLYGNEALREYNFGLKCSLNRELKMRLFREDNAKNLQKLQMEGLPEVSLEYLLDRFCPSFKEGLWLDVTRFNLPNLLRYEDRNAMAVGVENRTPFTDYRLVEFAFSLADTLKFQKGYSKYILRKLLERLGSKKLAWRLDKIGFGAPEGELMRELGYNYESIFDIRMLIFNVLRGR